MPQSITQNGIAEALGMTRSHVSLEIGRNSEKGMVEYTLDHVKGCRQRRRCYHLTPKGVDESIRIRSDLAKRGIERERYHREEKNGRLLEMSSRLYDVAGALNNAGNSNNPTMARRALEKLNEAVIELTGVIA